MALINFEDPNIKVIPAKHLYVVDKDGEQKEIKYIKSREWWNYVFSEKVKVESAEIIEQEDIKERPPHTYLDFFDMNKMAFQAKAIYFIDSNGNAIEFINDIHKDWVNDYVSEDETSHIYYPDIPLSLNENLDINISESTLDDTAHIYYEDIPINLTENLECTVNNPFGIELTDFTLVPLFILNLNLDISEDLICTVNNSINDNATITLTSI